LGYKDFIKVGGDEEVHQGGGRIGQSEVVSREVEGRA